MKEIGLYIHIPFCNHLCTYCDFVKRVSTDETKNKYFESLCNEITLKKDIFTKYKIKTIYIGGGTPSSISSHNLERLFIKLSDYIDLANLQEFSFECNVEDISEELVSLLSKYHVNRVSIGVETLNSRILTIMGRMCNYSDLCRKMQILRDFGLKNVNFDYMYGIEPLSLSEIIDDLDKLISLKPTHISCYSLILEENTILYHKYLKGDFVPMNDDKETEIYYKIVDFLKSKGYNHYEISNFSISSYESIHNIIYWSNEEYLGIGLASSSYLKNYRFKNIDKLNEYISFYMGDNSNLSISDIFKKSTIENEKITFKNQMDYEVILGFRMVKGIDLKKFVNKYNNTIFNYYPEISNLVNEKLLEKDENYIRISPNYLYLQNQILIRILN